MKVSPCWECHGQNNFFFFSQVMAENITYRTELHVQNASEWAFTDALLFLKPNRVFLSTYQQCKKDELNQHERDIH